MKHKEQKTASEIFEDIEKWNDHIKKLDKIRNERKELNISSFASKMKAN